MLIEFDFLFFLFFRCVPNALEPLLSHSSRTNTIQQPNINITTQTQMEKRKWRFNERHSRLRFVRMEKEDSLFHMSCYTHFSLFFCCLTRCGCPSHVHYTQPMRIIIMENHGVRTSCNRVHTTKTNQHIAFQHIFIPIVDTKPSLRLHFQNTFHSLSLLLMLLLNIN